MVMVRLWLLLIFVAVTSCTTDPAVEVVGILQRLLGEDGASRFDIKVDPTISETGKDTFSLKKTSDDEKVFVIGSSGVAAAWGVHHYLTQHCGGHISWDGDRLPLPETLPDVNQTIASLDKYKYYQNVCTSGYSSLWWDWERWQREIDWMALKGINLALAFGGQEAIWKRVYDGLGIVETDFTGPAFLAWGRMGNMRGFGGGLSDAWHKRSIALQHQILDRMRALGITPVLPAFNGILPPAFNQTYPNANGTYIRRWNSFPDEYCCPFLLDPADPLFLLISRIFLREYIAEFGTDHIYNSDTFNENLPSSSDSKYLSATAQAIYQGMYEEDPEAIWMVQGWMFLDLFWGKEQVKAYVTSIPLGKMLILDLQSDLTPLFVDYESYYGQPFIWCTLHNFGGQLGLYGHLDRVNNGIVQGRAFPNSTMVGIGITPEGIDQNYIMYELTLNGTMHAEAEDMSNWVKEYIHRRYGFVNSQVNEGWELLRESVYNYNLLDDGGFKIVGQVKGNHIAQNILTKKPSLSLTEITWYNKAQVYNALKLFVNASAEESVRNSPLFAHDLVDTARQTIQLAISVVYERVVVNYLTHQVVNFTKQMENFLGLLDELDSILKTNKKFLLGPWLESAKAAASSPEESEQYEWNARNQITLWGPTGQIRDYAAKQWSGMISDFYKPRWQLFLNALNSSLAGEERYNRTAVDELMFSTVEEPFTKDNKTYQVEPEPDPIGRVTKFLKDWSPILDGLFPPTPTFDPSVIGYEDFQVKRNYL